MTDAVNASQPTDADGSYDAVLLLSFGGPEGPDDVMPFLENVTRGRGVPRERLAEVSEHYHHFGGVSPINSQNRALLAAIRADFAAAGLDLPVYWGNRNWGPYVEDTVKQMTADGVRRALVFATSAYCGYSGCGQYVEDMARARTAAGLGAPELAKVRPFFNHPGFVLSHADAVRKAFASLPDDQREIARLVFTAHSVPKAMDAAAGVDGHLYSRQLAEVAALVAAEVGQDEWDLVWQSRSGPPQVPWLEPDINDHLENLAAAGERAVVVSPIGFVSDHLEVIWDLDNEAAETAEKLGLAYARAGTPGTGERFVTMIRELITERLDSAAVPGALGTFGVMPPGCGGTCGKAPRRPAAASR